MTDTAPGRGQEPYFILRSIDSRLSVRRTCPIFYLMKVRGGISWVMLLLLFSTDLTFMTLHIVHTTTPILGDPFFSIERDLGYAEAFQYIKEFWIALLLGGLWFKTRQGLYGVWSLFFLYLLADDSLKIHETVGECLATRLNMAPLVSLRPQDLGELLVLGTVAALFLILIGILYRRARTSAKTVTKQICFLVGLAAFAGAFLDVLHSAFRQLPAGNWIGMAEDGGEMVAITLICWYVLNVFERVSTRVHYRRPPSAPRAVRRTSPAPLLRPTQRIQHAPE